MNAGVVGIAGLPCAGKSAVCRLLAEDGWFVIDCDRLGHEALDDPGVRAALAHRFGSGIFGADGRVLRPRLADRVFGDREPGALAALEAMVHPWILARARDFTAKALAAGRPAAWEAALLFASGADGDCGMAWVVESPEADRAARARARGWAPEELARRDMRLRPGLDRALSEGRARRIRNDGTPGGLRRALAEALGSSYVLRLPS